MPFFAFKKMFAVVSSHSPSTLCVNKNEQIVNSNYGLHGNDELHSAHVNMNFAEKINKSVFVVEIICAGVWSIYYVARHEPPTDETEVTRPLFFRSDFFPCVCGSVCAFKRFKVN